MAFFLLTLAVVVIFGLGRSRMLQHAGKRASVVAEPLFTREAWKSRNPGEVHFLAGMILGLASFWNGAAVIGGLLILFGFAVFSDGKAGLC